MLKKLSSGIVCAAFLTVAASGSLTVSRQGPRDLRAGTEWWSLQPVRSRIVPKIKGVKAIGRNPIDAFVQAELAKRRLLPAPPADRRTLIRRVYFDLVGLPPPPEAVEAFVRERDPRAYERLVDSLLADPGYGERWGRHWLDVVRFGESQGYERDHLRPNSWPYRDYVIRAFNDDKSYDRFIVEQLAGDVLAPQTGDGIAATGFLAAGPWDEVGHTSVSPAVRKRARDEELEDVIGTTTQTFLGLTVNCARCHDHKFDPIPTEDYYRLRAAFEGIVPGERTALTADESRLRNTRVAEARSIVIELQNKIEAIEENGIGRVLAAASSSPPATRLQPPAMRWSFDEGRVRGTAGSVELRGGAEVVGRTLKLSGKGAYIVAGAPSREIRVKTLEAWVRLNNLNQRGGAALTIQSPDGATFDAIVFGEREPRKWSAGSNGFARTKDLDAPEETDTNRPIHIAITYGPDNFIAVYRNGVRYGTPYLPPGNEGGLRTYAPGKSQVLIGLRHTGSTGFFEGEIEEARIYDRLLTPAQVADSFRAGPRRVDPAQVRAALTPMEKADLDRVSGELAAALSRLRDAEAAPVVYAVKSTTPLPTHVLVRGDPDNPGKLVTAGGLSCCRSQSPDIGAQVNTPEGERRLALARWIADRRNPLTARVMVNRVWHYHFGRGLVATPNDFGFNGDRPTHPELLDWLAAKFMDGGWRLKPLHRLILLSNTYRQSSRYDPAAARIDSDNQFLWRFGPRRLEGEAVRDSILAVSSRLNPKRGGPSFRPFSVVVDNSSFYTLVDKDDPELDRRTVYRMNINGARMPLLESLDCPDPSTKTPKRGVTTTALQALELMNSTFVNRQARWFAERVRKEAGVDITKQVERGYTLALGRSPSPVERTEAESLVRRSGLAALGWAIFNMNEFLYVR
jgi:hypothetical protein